MVRIGFNSLDYNEVNIVIGAANARKGRFWIDDFRLDEVGLINILRRPGTPVRVVSEQTGASYQEGEDFVFSKEEVLSYNFDHPEPIIKAPAGTRISDGERICVDYYQALALKRGAGQMGSCLSEPAVFEIWQDIVSAVQEHVSPKYFFISGDELRHGGWCEACQNRGISSAELLGEYVTRQVRIIEGVNPNAEILIWSDMFDPNHNAKNNYYLFKGDLDGTWNHIPKYVIMACWNYDTRSQSLHHFDENGFKTIGCGYYDSGTLDTTVGWLKSLRQTTGSCGIMYTTWRNEYDLLEEFGDLAREPESNE